jgi:hypothetical protein
MSASDPMSDERLADWVDGRMSDREQERFRAELRVNAQLRADLAAYEATVAAVRAALQAPTRPSAMADRVLAAIAAKPAAPAAAPPSRRLYWSLLSAAALLAVAFLLNAWPAGETPTVATDMAQAAPDGTGDARAAGEGALGADTSGRRYGGRGAPDAKPAAPAGSQGAPPLAEAMPGAPNAVAGVPATAPEDVVALGARRSAVEQTTGGGDPSAGMPATEAGAVAVTTRSEGMDGTRPPSAPAAPAARASKAAETAPTPFVEIELTAAVAPPRPSGGEPPPPAGPLAGEALRTAFAAFFTQAADPAADAAVAAWTTANGELSASPWLDAVVGDDAASTRVWIVEGPKDDLAALLAAASAFARARDGVVRNGETSTPAPPAADGKPATTPSARLVLRVKLRRRQ